ncbi:hypothetical protein WGA77_30950 [Nocardia seriolae]|uniref:hypothetical protein n=1 Tax=Nocardia seriolae TaxID=37332 RepID=UPI0030D32B5C
MVLDRVVAELDSLMSRIGGRFARSEPRERVREYVSGLLAGLERKNGWTLAERAGETGPQGMQRLLRAADWDVEAGAHGPREYDWAYRQIEGTWARGRGHWLLARRALTPNSKGELEIAYYLCYGPATSRLVDLAWTAGSRWHVEEAFQQAKGEAGLDHYQIRDYRAWYAHITLSMLAPAYLAASKTIAAKGDSATSPQT